MVESIAALMFAATFGGITGDIRLGEKYLPEIPLTLKCGAEEVLGKTDKEGSFRLTAKAGGKCQLSITYQKQTASIDVVLFDQPARYRLLLELKDAKYTIKRA